MNLYRITVRGQDGTISEHETEAENLELAVQGEDERLELLNVERINPLNGNVTRFDVADGFKVQDRSSDPRCTANGIRMRRRCDIEPSAAARPT
jgi:hypothetical protein